ncbi:MAG: peptidylprolyl isomerase [Ignavibacteriales bacterium]|nr:MAG: peptidylprolyl isomerase [Ignavibacteriales bacterium]
MYERKKIYLFVVLFCACQTITNANVHIGDEQVIATVGGHSITLSEFKLRYNNFLNSSGTRDSKAVRDAVLNNMINEILLYSYDSNEEVLSDVNFIREVEWSKRKVVLAHFKEQEIYSKISVTEPEMREAFLRANESLTARHLYASTEVEANELYRLVNNGNSFEELAKQVFTDSTLKNNGGLIGSFTWGDMDPAFEEAAYSLRVGEISTPIKTAQGYSIIKLESRNQKPLLTEYEFQNKKAHLEKVLRIKKNLLAEKEYINQIFDRNQLSFNDDVVKEMLAGMYSANNVESEPDQMTKELVSYKGKSYTVREIEQRIFTIPDSHINRINSIESLKAVIEGLLINEIIFGMAEERGYVSAQSVIDMMEAYKQNIFFKYKIERISQNAFLPDSTLEKYYRENIHTFSSERELNVQEILVDNESLADSLFRQISNGEDFGLLANKFSIRRWSAENNGEMGFAPISRYGNYKDTFWQSEVGTLIGPLHIENLYGIFRVLGKKDSEPLDFEIVKSDVLKAARFENQTVTLRDYIKELKKKINVSINSALLDSYNILG